jgi:Raf kinase inhibitor-like YbhB/YbcL family protein
MIELMKLVSQGFSDGGAIPPEYAFGKIDTARRVALSGNRNPDFTWTDVPLGTLSFALICHDPDVPSRGDDVNQEGKVVPASLPRVDFFHWVLVDIPGTRHSIAAGEFADGITTRGKPGPASIDGMRQGLNDYTGWFAGDGDMSGDYFGYDGPCPPWNDEIAHRYVFTLFALDVAHLAVEGKFTGTAARQAMAGHVLAQVSVSGRYTLNPAVSL